MRCTKHPQRTSRGSSPPSTEISIKPRCGAQRVAAPTTHPLKLPRPRIKTTQPPTARTLGSSRPTHTAAAAQQHHHQQQRQLVPMGFLDRLVGRPAQPSDEEKASAASAAAAAGQPPQHAPSTSGEVLHDIAPHAGAGAFPGAASTRLYDPYEGISSTVGGAARKQSFSLPEGPEFVFQDEAAARRRGWGENLQFYTGIGYLGGETGEGVLAFGCVGGCI